MKKVNYLFIALISVLTLSSYYPLEKEKDFKSSGDTIYYFFSGHPYQWYSANRVDYRLEQLDYSKYSGIWLGGDNCAEATLEYSTLVYLNNLVDLGNPMTFFTLGNHDARHGNQDWLYDITSRETFFAHSFNGITAIVMNTTLVPSDCERMDKQFRMIKNVCDSIEKSTHLIVVMHHCLLDSIPGVSFPAVNASLPYWEANCFDKNNSFYRAIYPLLVQVENKEIDVICIIGDLGMWAKQFYRISTDGVQFLGCGLNNTVFLDTADFNNAPKDKVLILQHIPSLKKLTWNFHSIDSLLLNQ